MNELRCQMHWRSKTYPGVLTVDTGFDHVGNHWWHHRPDSGVRTYDSVAAARTELASMRRAYGTDWEMRLVVCDSGAVL